MIFFYRSIIAQVFLNIFIVYYLWRIEGLPKWIKKAVSVLYFFETVIYFIGLLFETKISHVIFRNIQVINGIWVIYNLYIGCIILLFCLTKYFLCKIETKTDVIKFVKIRNICFLILFLFMSFEVYKGYTLFDKPIIREHKFTLANKALTIEERTQYKLLVVSDIHLGYIIDKWKLRMFRDIIMAQNADIIVINGDLIDYNVEPLIKSNMDEELKTLTAPNGVFLIPGNHEYKNDAEKCLNWIRSCGITVLKDSVININNQMYIIGRDDRSQSKNRKPITTLIEQVEQRESCIYFAHHPNDIEEILQYNIPLVVSGHTHYGQIFPANLFCHLAYGNAYGWKENGECRSYTSSGLGLSGAPLRIGSSSEILILTIEL